MFNRAESISTTKTPLTNNEFKGKFFAFELDAVPSNMWTAQLCSATLPAQISTTDIFYCAIINTARKNL